MRNDEGAEAAFFNGALHAANAANMIHRSVTYENECSSAKVRALDGCFSTEGCGIKGNAIHFQWLVCTSKTRIYLIKFSRKLPVQHLPLPRPQVSG